MRPRGNSWPVIAVAVFSTIALILRAVVIYNSGLWADEGSFLIAITAPFWATMIDFLKRHESHPPLFYILMRAWGIMTGWGDRALMIMPLVFGVLIVPASYLVGAALLTRRAALISAGLGAVSPSLIEHSAQLRPYGLLTLLALISTALFVRVITRPTRGEMAAYVISSALMLYTHHWGWVILTGQCGAAIVFTLPLRRQQSGRVLLRFATLLLLVFLCYAPWLPALIYQSHHAGHGPIAIEGFQDVAKFLVFGLYRVIETLFLGRLADRKLVALTAVVLTIATIIYTRSRQPRCETESVSDQTDARVNVRLLLLIAGFALLAALLLSPVNNLLQPRGIATVMPLLLLVASYTIAKIRFWSPKKAHAQLLSVTLAFGLAASTLELPPLLTTRRSNVEEISRVVQSRMKSSDLLVLAPEWFAASFDHYFPSSIEQIDYPNDGRSSMIDFSDAWEGRYNSAALPRLSSRLAAARAGSRRVWLVLERQQLREFTKNELAKAYRHRQLAPFTTRDVRAIYSTLSSLYGKPSRYAIAGQAPLHDEFVAFLFSPR